MITNPPLFILGNPRSGTSLLRSLLNVHQDLCIAPECGFLLWLYPKWKDGPWNAEHLKAFGADVFGSRKFETWGLTPHQLEAQIGGIPNPSFARAAQAVYRAYAVLKGKPNAWVGDKNNYYITQGDVLHQIFPDATFIHIVRDVRDVACSYRELGTKEIQSVYKPQLPFSPEGIAREWMENNTAAINATRGVKCVFTRYEDIIAHPMDTMNDIFEQLGLMALPNLTTTSHLINFDEPQEFMQWKPKLGKAIDQGSVERYRTELSVAEIDSIELVAGKLMNEFGYKSIH